MDERTTCNVIRLDDYRRLPISAGAHSTPADFEDFDLCDAYGRTIADWIWAALFDDAAEVVDEDQTPHCEVIYWQFAVGAGRRR